MMALLVVKLTAAPLLVMVMLPLITIGCKNV